MDQDRFAALCDEIQSLGMTCIATAHCPVIGEESIEQAFALTRALPSVPPPPIPDQAALEAIVAAMAGTEPVP